MPFWHIIFCKVCQKALENINVIIRYVKSVTFDDFIGNEKLIDAVLFRLIQLAESIKGLSEEYKEKRPSVSWGLIVGFRNGIVHDYGKTDYSIVYEIVSKDIPLLRDALSSK